MEDVVTYGVTVTDLFALVEVPQTLAVTDIVAAPEKLLDHVTNPDELMLPALEGLIDQE